MARLDEDWSCTVSLRYVADKDGNSVKVAPPVQFGEVIRDRSLVEERVRRAQRAALNPDISALEILDGLESDLSMESFTMNCVLLCITGRCVADLSFCDLPGA